MRNTGKKLLVGLALLVMASLFISSSILAVEEPPYFILQWGNEGSNDGEFRHPWAIAIDTTGDIYVTDNENHRVQKFDPQGNFILKWGSKGSDHGQFRNPGGIAIDSANNVYVADKNNRIQKFTPEGVFIAQWPTYIPYEELPSYSPAEIAVDAAGDIYLSEFTSHRFLRFVPDNPDKYPKAVTASDGTTYGIIKFGDTGQFSYPAGVAVDKAKNVHVVDSGNSCIQKFNALGKFLQKRGRKGTDKGKFDTPWGIAIDSSGNIYVTDNTTHNVQKFNAGGGFMTKWGDWGPFAEQFSFPQGIAVDDDKNIYVVDSRNYRLQKFSFPQAITKHALVDKACLVVNDIYTDPVTGLTLHGTYDWETEQASPPGSYLDCVVSKVRELRIRGKLSETAAKAIIKRALESGVNKPPQLEISPELPTL